MMIFYDLEVKLLYVRPAPKRRFLIPQSATFLELHEAIQAAFQWYNCHMWEFEGGADDPDDDEPMTLPKERLLSDYFGEAGDREIEALYRYDFGDGWEHLIQLKGVVTHDAPTHWRRLISGLHMAPPEDCGGTPGYERLHAMLKTGQDPWGEVKGAALKKHLKHYNLTAQDLRFSLADQRARFDLLLASKPQAPAPKPPRQAPPKPAPPKPAPAKLSAERRYVRVPTKVYRPGGGPPPNAALIKARCAQHVKKFLSRRELEVFDLMEDHLVLHRQSDDEDVRLALSSWLYAITLDEAQGSPLKLRKPAIHAAAVTCWLDATFGPKLNIKLVSEEHNVSSPPVKAAYLELCALVGDAPVQQTRDALVRFFREVWAEELASEGIEPSEPLNASDVLLRLIHATPMPDEVRAVLLQLMASMSPQERARLSLPDLIARLSALGLDLGVEAKAPKQKTSKKKKP